MITSMSSNILFVCAIKNIFKFESILKDSTIEIQNIQKH